MGDPGVLKLLNELRDLHHTKSADYGSEDDALANYTAAERSGIDGWKSAWCRVVEKVGRIEKFVLTGKLENEQIEESLRDLALTAIATLALYRRTTCAATSSSSERDLSWKPLRQPGQ